jgi:hypothetical protein
MRLHIEGHNHRHGYAVSRIWSDAECSALPAATDDEIAPVRYFASRSRAERFVSRWNGCFAAQ